MIIERTVLNQLKIWQGSKQRKFLLLQGAPGSGKTWVLKSFGNSRFTNTAYFDCAVLPMQDIFKDGKNLKDIIAALNLLSKEPILPKSTLIIFDNIDKCSQNLDSLISVFSETDEYFIAASSLPNLFTKENSLLNKKIDFLRIYPVSFKEFLEFYDKESFDFIESLKEISEIPSGIIDKLKKIYADYLIIGGMPAALSAFLDNRGMAGVEEEIDNILNSYSLLFAENPEKSKIESIWRSLPLQHIKENKKFMYKSVQPSARAREYEPSLLILEKLGLIYRVFEKRQDNAGFRKKRNGELFDNTALKDKDADKINTNSFKVYVLDIGIFRKSAKIPADLLLSNINILGNFAASIEEGFVLQSLAAQFDKIPYYWTSDRTAEIDFLIDFEGLFIPIEVKTLGKNSGKSFSLYNKRYAPKYAIRYSYNNLKIEGNTINIPIFLSDWTIKLLHLRK